MDALERAKKALQFDDLFQSSAAAEIRDGFDPKLSPVGDALCRLQFKHQVIQSNVLEVSMDDGPQALFRVYIDVGIRLFYEEEGKENHECDVQLEASYCLDYRITDQALRADQEALDEFALRNASYHLWPFWREYVMSQCSRMNVPKIPLPMRFFGSQPAKVESSDSP